MTLTLYRLSRIHPNVQHTGWLCKGARTYLIHICPVIQQFWKSSLKLAEKVMAFRLRMDPEDVLLLSFLVAICFASCLDSKDSWDRGIIFSLILLLSTFIIIIIITHVLYEIGDEADKLIWKHPMRSSEVETFWLTSFTKPKKERLGINVLVWLGKEGQNRKARRMTFSKEKYMLGYVTCLEKH